MINSIATFELYDGSTPYIKGSVVLDGSDIKVFDGQKFSTIKKSSELNKRILPKNCTRCGAPVDSTKLRCDYCNCEY